ncbi:uncharacterized protein LOC134038988 [Osmerus eperlanus]|uniref:uncharacterized protein LOC134038988 n=1 Tax=Osmerus eperlanus TaxID=29151 RepID=UPI002E161A61
MKRKAEGGDIASFFAKKIQRSTQEEEKDGNEGEGSKLERPRGSEQEKTTEGDEEISEGDEEKEKSVRGEEEAPDSERGTEAGSNQEEADEDDREKEDRPAIPPGPHDISKCKGNAA